MILKKENNMLCPFRKRIYYLAGDSIQSWSTHSSHAEYTEEEFLEYKKDECALWNGAIHRCCLYNLKNLARMI